VKKPPPVAHPAPAAAGPPSPPNNPAGSVYNAPIPKGSTVTTPQLSPSQLYLWKDIMPQAQQYASSNLTIPTTQQLVAPINAQQTQGINDIMSAAGNQAALAQKESGFLQWMTSPFELNSMSNPLLSGAMSAADRPITQQLTESTLPQIETGAASAGQYGSSREGIAQGIASQAASQAVGDTNAKIAEASYQSNLDAMTKAMGLAPSIQQMLAVPGQNEYAAGSIIQQQQQAQDTANLERQLYNANVPLMKAQNLAGLSGSQGTGTVSSAPASTSLLQGILGGGGLGASIGAGLGSIIPGLGTAAGAGIGGVAGGGLGALLAELG
jgi:hypothetical protein